MPRKCLVINLDRCTGCDSCIVSCKFENHLPLGTFYNRVMQVGPTGSYPNVERYNLPVQCQQCTHARCVEVCPTGASYRDSESGIVLVDESKCIGCQYCSTACPFDVPRYQEGLRTTVNKCTGCVDRIEQGREPACVTTCQPDALVFGDRDEMIALAHERADFLKARGYEDAVVYGEDEMGGLHVIQVLKYGVAAHGQVENPQANPVVGLTQIMKPITGAVTGLTVAGLAAMFALGVGYKRDKLAYNPETKDTISVDTGQVVKHGDGQDEETVMEHITENLPGKKGGN